MTPTALRSDLADELSKILEHMNFKDQNENDCKINVLEQNLPIQMDDEDTEPFPYLLIKVTDGDIPEDESQYTVIVNMIIGIYYSDEDAQGEDIILNVIQEIIERFRKHPVLKAFTMQNQVKWALTDEVTHPYYFGGIETHWTVPMIQREGLF